MVKQGLKIQKSESEYKNLIVRISNRKKLDIFFTIRLTAEQKILDDLKSKEINELMI